MPIKLEIKEKKQIIVLKKFFLYKKKFKNYYNPFKIFFLLNQLVLSMFENVY